MVAVSRDILQGIVVGMFVFTITGLVLYYQKPKRERDKETQDDIVLRSLVPAFLLGVLVFLILWSPWSSAHSASSASRSSSTMLSLQKLFRREPPKMYLEEDYFD